MSGMLRRIMNAIMKPLLSSPLHFFASGWCMLITVRGRRTGNLYTTPVYYKQSGDCLHFFSGRALKWVRNLEGGAPVTVRLKGKERSGRATLLEDGPEVEQQVRAFYPRMSADEVAELVLVEVRL